MGERAEGRGVRDDGALGGQGVTGPLPSPPWQALQQQPPPQRPTHRLLQASEGSDSVSLKSAALLASNAATL